MPRSYLSVVLINRAFYVMSCCPPTWLLPIVTEITIHLNKVVLEPLVSPDLAIYIFKQVKVKMTLDLVMSP